MLALAGITPEHGAGDFVQIGAEPLDNIRPTIHQRFQQGGEYTRAGSKRLVAVNALDNGVYDRKLLETNGNEHLLRQDESQGRQDGIGSISLGDNRSA